MAGNEDFLSRWSRRKHAAKRGEAGRSPASTPEAPVGSSPGAEAVRDAPSMNAAVAAAPAGNPAADASPAGGPADPLPPLESLTPQSDFAPFMASGVDADVRRQALRTLFADPHFNTMDMLDVYVDDYSKPDPLPESWLAKLEQTGRLGDRAERDREEARRKALEESGAGAPAPGSAADPVADATDRVVERESAAPPSGPRPEDSSDDANPLRNEGESGT